MRRFWSRFWKNSDGAVAPIVALSLTALIAVGGIAFDFAHVAAMDTELQDAADHAALAAATQLDGDPGAQTRATSAAQSLITNKTRFAATDATHDRNVAVVQITFYSAYASASSNTAATGDADSNVVQVEVDTRTANYAFTPIVAAFHNSLKAKAVAGVTSAVCGVVPFFICNPEEPANNTDVHLAPSGVDPGTGILMAQGGTQWGPGNFGFLDQLGNGANSVAEALASNSLLGNCQPTSGVVTETGNILNAVRDSLNMRFDFKPVSSSACKSPPCQPSTNVIKDVAKTANGCSWNFPAMTAAQVSTTTPPRYFPTSDADLPASVTPQTMGSPRDICHYFQDSSGNFPLCANGRVGDGVWDRSAYFRTNHPGLDWVNEPGLGANVTRYQTYLWEAADSSRLTTRALTGPNPVQSAYGPAQNVCLGPGLAPDATGTDRRRITAAVVNCRRVNATTGLNGKKTLPVAGFIDVFLVEPSLDRSRCTSGAGCTGNATFTMNGVTYKNSYGSRDDIYIEVIGASGTGQGGAVPQITRRDVPRLIE
jgi:Flp pilus assembly protein TadG